MTTTHSPTTVYADLVDELAAAGTKVVFGLAGEDNIFLIDDLRRTDMTFHATSHENVAVNMADGYSWRSGDIGICTVTRGSGVLNAAAAIRTAVRGGKRVLVLTADMPAKADPKVDLKAVDYPKLAQAL